MESLQRVDKCVAHLVRASHSARQRVLGKFSENGEDFGFVGRVLRQLAGRIDLSDAAQGGPLKRDELLALAAVCDEQLPPPAPAAAAADGAGNGADAAAAVPHGESSAP